MEFDQKLDTDETHSNTSALSIASLPVRIKGSYLAKFKKTTLISNYHKVNVKKNLVIYLYHFQFCPKIQNDDRAKKNELINKAMDDIKQIIGIPVISGRTIYGSTKPKFHDEKKTSIQIETISNVKYIIKIQLVKTFNMKDLNNPQENIKDFNSIMFLNNLIKTFMKQLNFVEIGRSGKYFDSKSKVKLQGISASLYHGYSTSFNFLQNGLYLKVDSINKIVQSRTVLEYINLIYAKNKEKNKDQKRDILKCSLKNKTVMANYGNSKYWRIDDIIFDTDVETSIANPETNQTISQYYATKYNIIIRNKKQPLLKAQINRKGTFVILVPELLCMTGISDDQDEKVRRTISQSTIKQPHEKLESIENLMKKMNRQLKDFGPKSVAKALEIQIDPNLTKIESINLGLPSLLLGDRNQVDPQKVSYFQLFDKPLFNSKIQLKIMLIHFKRFDPQPLLNLFELTCKNLKLKIRQKIYCLGEFQSKNASNQLENILLDKDEKFKNDFNIAFIILPNSGRSAYKKIKRVSLLKSNIITQVCLQATLGKKNFSSICTKVLLQIAAKVGNILWAPDVPRDIKSKIMIIGIDISTDGECKDKSVVGFCASLDENFSKFYSRVIYKNKTNVAIESIKQLLAEAMVAFYKHNNSNPSQIIVLRDGCTSNQIYNLRSMQVTDAINLINEIDSKPLLTYIVIDKKVSQKFFFEKDGKFMNPNAGTIINSTVVSKNYDFYMIPQNCRMGTASPTYFKIIYTNSKMQEGKLQYLLYTQCYNYMNWAGSIKIPSVIQYARKISTFTAEYINKVKQVQSILNTYLYYI